MEDFMQRRGRIRKLKKYAGSMQRAGELPVEDGVEISDRGLFMIGGKEQTREDFDRNVIKRVESIAPFEMVWEAAIKYLSKYPREILVNPQKFYKHVYELVRDKFMEKIIEEPEIQEIMDEKMVEREKEGMVKGRKVKKRKPSTKQQGLLKWIMGRE